MPFVDFADMPWRPREKNPAEIPDWLRDTILDNGSLTERLKALYHEEFLVEVIRHQWLTPTHSEQIFLQCKEDCSKASIREVLLYGSGVPIVFARSVLPEGSLTGKNHALLELGSKPLGEYIFNQPDLKRGPIEIAEIPARQFNRHLNTHYQHETAWGRRSLFYLGDKPISVCEVFLPAFRG